LTSFSPSLPTLYSGEVNNQQGEATMGNSILTSHAPASKEELQYREQDREREEATLRRKRDMKDWRRRSGQE
jgi:hypothetical protein